MQTWLGRLRHITMPNFLETGLSKADILRFLEFSKWLPPPSWIFEVAKFYWLLGWRWSTRISVPNFVKIGQLVAKILRFFDFSRCRLSLYWIVEFAKFYWLTVSGEPWRITVPNFVKIGRPPSLIRLRHIWTTHIEYLWSLWVSITLQNLVMIDAVVFIIWKCNIWRVWLENAYSRPKDRVFGQFDDINGLQYQPKPKNVTPLRESASFEPLSVKMWWTVWPIGELLKIGV